MRICYFEWSCTISMKHHETIILPKKDVKNTNKSHQLTPEFVLDKPDKVKYLYIVIKQEKCMIWYMVILPSPNDILVCRSLVLFVMVLTYWWGLTSICVCSHSVNPQTPLSVCLWLKLPTAVCGLVGFLTFLLDAVSWEEQHEHQLKEGGEKEWEHSP